MTPAHNARALPDHGQNKRGDRQNLSVARSPTVSLPARSLAPGNEKSTIETTPMLKDIGSLQPGADKIPPPLRYRGFVAAVRPVLGSAQFRFAIRFRR